MGLVAGTSALSLECADLYRRGTRGRVQGLHTHTLPPALGVKPSFLRGATPPKKSPGSASAL